MEIKDLANSKKIKVIATTSAATIVVATGTAPVMAHANDTQNTDYSQKTSSHISDNQIKDYNHDGPKSPAAPPKTPEHDGPKSPAAPPKAPETPKETPKQEQKLLPAVASASTEKPKELPKTGPAQVATVGIVAVIAGYFANLFRLKRKDQ
jgi:hypothetical protein